MYFDLTIQILTLNIFITFYFKAKKRIFKMKNAHVYQEYNKKESVKLPFALNDWEIQPF